ncbi:MAG: MJ0042-type zinc finger domain-containing protein, partial [Burkholderiaceae bacterium]
MALATTCPQCKTSFKVIPDQLKLRRGLVRCGVCQHVFSGIDYLRYVDDAGKLTARGGTEDREGAAPGRAPAVPVAPPASGSPVAPGSPGAPVARISPAVPGPRPIQPREQ